MLFTTYTAKYSHLASNIKSIIEKLIIIYPASTKNKKANPHLYGFASLIPSP